MHKGLKPEMSQSEITDQPMVPRGKRLLKELLEFWGYKPFSCSTQLIMEFIP